MMDSQKTEGSRDTDRQRQGETDRNARKRKGRERETKTWGRGRGSEREQCRAPWQVQGKTINIQEGEGDSQSEMWTQRALSIGSQRGT